jgi:hypothetical protein
MRKKFILFLILVSLSMTLIVSCKKTTEEMIVGKWQGKAAYTNGVLDPFNDLFKEFVLEINDDGTGVSTSFASQNLTWYYTESTNKLHVETVDVESDGLTVYGDTTDYTVLLVDESLLNLQTTGEGDDEGKVLEYQYTLVK